MTHRFLLPSLAIVLAGAASAHGAVVLTIDITDPSSVVLTATGANSAVTGSVYVNYNGGITLENFFPTNQSIALPGKEISGTLTASGTTSAFDGTVTFNYDENTGDVKSGDDLSIYAYSAPGSDTQDFSTTTPAFTGSSIVDLTGYTLPTVGTTGNVNMGFKAAQGGTIGSFQVVPEPSTYAAFAGLAALGLVWLRRRDAVRA